MEMAEIHIESLTNSYEEIFLDHEIYIQPDRDPYRGGFEWSVCREGVELDAGLEFSIDDALKKAQGVVTALKQVVSPAP
jgi:hypothetical protein